MTDNPSDFSAISDDDLRAQLSQALQGLAKNIGFTNVQSARLGNGNFPPTVIIPPEQALFPGMMWVHWIVDGTKNEFQALNMCDGLSYDNATAFTPVRVGYLPKSTTLAIIGLDPADVHVFTGGATPMQNAVQHQAFVTPERMASMKLGFDGTGLVLSLTGGVIRYGPEQELWVPANPAFLDVTDYIPATASTTRYIMVGINPDFAPVVVEGAEFPSSDPQPANYIPLVTEAGVLNLGWVRLYNGMTVGVQELITPNQSIYYMPIDDTGGATTGAVALVQADEPTDAEPGLIWLQDNDTAPPALMLRDVDNATWNQGINIGKANQAFRRLYVGSVSYSGSSGGVTLVSGVALLESIGAMVLPIFAESGTADDLDTLTISDIASAEVILRAAPTHTITVKHGTGNIYFQDEADHDITGNRTVRLFIDNENSVCYGY